MSEIKITPRAKEAYDTVCRYFDNRKWTYEKKEEDLLASVLLKGDDIPVNVVFNVFAEREILCVSSPLAMEIKEDKVGEFTFVLALLSNAIYNGWYAYDMEHGAITFRAAAPFMGSTVSEDMVNYMLNIAYSTVNAHNDLLLALNNGMITVEQFFEALQQ